MILMKVRPAPIAGFLKKLLGIHRIDVTTEAAVFYADPVSVLGHALLMKGVYEPGMLQVIDRHLSPSGVFVDLGANEGYFTVAAAKRVGPNGRIVAVEPQPRLQAILARNLARNGVKNATVVTQAVSNHRGAADLFLSPDTNTGSSSFRRATRYAVPTVQVETVTLADILDSQNLSSVDLMKVDIEGWEYEAILGSPEVFKKQRIRALALEMHPSFIRERNLDPDEILRFLTSCGYRADETLECLVLVAPVARAGAHS